jgi:hypothetical protein
MASRSGIHWGSGLRRLAVVVIAQAALLGVMLWALGLGILVLWPISLAVLVLTVVWGARWTVHGFARRFTGGSRR